jgi:hypothetical protein
MNAAELEDIVQAIRDFDEWVWCTCSECRTDARSHVIDAQASLGKIMAAIRAAAEKNP